MAGQVKRTGLHKDFPGIAVNMSLNKQKIRIGITLGDPSGIGPEIAARAVRALAGKAEFILIGDRRVFDRVRGPWSMVHGPEFVDLRNVSPKNFRYGIARAEYGRASIEYLDQAMKMLKRGWIDALATCPICKESVKKAGFSYSGHTEYLARRTGAKNTVMLLLNKHLKFALVTRHIPLKKVSDRISKHSLSRTIELAYRGLKEMFAVKRPRLLVCGLNPHASDNGVIGEEENRLIKPVIRSLRSKGLFLEGPLPADTAICLGLKRLYDCLIALYHDQALIPLKITGSSSGVNLTLGLGFVRSSPLHGVAFDIAGKGRADPSSMIESIKLAIKCSQNLKKA